MGAITLQDIATALSFVVALGGSIVAIVKGVKSVLKKLLDEQTKSLATRLDKIDERLDKVDSDNCKNYIVQALSSAERGVQLSTEERMWLAEEFEHYTASGGNSYIKEWHSRLQKDGKI